MLISCRVQFVHEFEAYPKSAPIPGLYAACIFVSVLPQNIVGTQTFNPTIIVYGTNVGVAWQLITLWY